MAFCILRCNLTEMRQYKMSAGGPLITIYNTIHCYEIVLPSCTTECVFVLYASIFFLAWLLIGCVYVSPNQTYYAYSNFCIVLREIIFSDNTDLPTIFGISIHRLISKDFTWALFCPHFHTVKSPTQLRSTFRKRINTILP